MSNIFGQTAKAWLANSRNWVSAQGKDLLASRIKAEMRVEDGWGLEVRPSTLPDNDEWSSRVVCPICGQKYAMNSYYYQQSHTLKHQGNMLTKVAELTGSWEDVWS